MVVDCNSQHALYYQASRTSLQTILFLSLEKNANAYYILILRRNAATTDEAITQTIMK